MEDTPKIYVLNKLPSLGELGDKTQIEYKTVCYKCGIKRAVKKQISYKFDMWNGEDLISVAGIYKFVSQRLKSELEFLENKEVTFTPVVNEKSDYFKPGKNAYQKEIPQFYLIEPLKVLDGPELWWKRVGKCESCNKHSWNYTIEGITSVVADDLDNYVQRGVYQNQWRGELIFNLSDPGAPIVTEDFIKIVNRVDKTRHSFFEAKWY
jgi:hypothetical protein